jgi:hypothetical protein
MNKLTKSLFLHPFLFQEAITYVLLVPNVVFFFLKISEGVRVHLPEVIAYTLIQTVFSLLIGGGTKFFFVSPALF